MASKRRSYRGTPAEHRAEAVKSAKDMLDMSRRVVRMVNSDDCFAALQQLVAASNVQGRYQQSRLHTSKRSTVLPRGGYTAIVRAQEAFARKCLR